MLLFDSNFVKLQYQCHAPEDQEDLAAFAVEAGGFADKLVCRQAGFAIASASFVGS